MFTSSIVIEGKGDKSVKKDVDINNGRSSIMLSDSTMILHKVKNGQTLYSISNLYNVSIIIVRYVFVSSW